MRTRVTFWLLAPAALAAIALSPAVASASPALVLPVPLRGYTVFDSTSFTSPSGNIGCQIDTDGVRCDIRERDWTPPRKPADCPEQVGYGQGITLSAGGQAEFVCAGDTALTGGNALAYGDTITAGSITCTSTEASIDCVDVQDGSQFSLSRQGYEID